MVPELNLVAIIVLPLAAFIVIMQFKRKKYLEGSINIIFYSSLVIMWLGMNTDAKSLVKIAQYILGLSALGLAINSFFELRRNKKESM